MKELITKELIRLTKLPEQEIINMIEIPPSSDLGDFSFPCFILAKEMKKNPVEIAKELASKIKSDEFEKVTANGPYLNFFLNRKNLVEDTLNLILKEKDKYGSSKEGKGKKIVIDLSAPNIAKPFGIGHLRSTIIGNSISNIYSKLGYKTIKINYLGDWGTPFGKIMAGYKKFGDEKKLKSEPIKHLYEIYVKVSKDESFEELGREWFKKLEDGDKEAVSLWKKFKELSIKEFDKIYEKLGVTFDIISGESIYNKKMDKTIKEIKDKKLLVESDGAEIVDLDKYGLGKCLIKKSDGATLYATRDITAAIDRYEKYKFDKMIYEVGQEQKLHFQQFFKVLELMGYKWAKSCIHIYHGLYLDNDGKKFATRKGKTIFMEDIIEETKSLAIKEIEKRDKLPKKELEERAKGIARAAIIYGDLKNYRVNDAIFDIDKFISFEGNTGPYLLYTYARARSILRKAGYKQKGNVKPVNVSENEKNLALSLSKFPEIVQESAKNFAPNIIANYAFDISQKFNEFYHTEQVIGSDNEILKLALVDVFSIVLKTSLSLLGINTLEKM